MEVISRYDGASKALPTLKQHSDSKFRSRELRVVLILVVPLLLLSGVLSFVQPSLTKASPTNGYAQSNIQVAQVVSLDSTLHVNWTPTTDPSAQYQLMVVRDQGTVQQAKVIGRTLGVAQANGLIPGRTYNVTVYDMGVTGVLTSVATATAATDPQSPMRNAAFYDDFNSLHHGDFDYNYYDIRTEGCGPEEDLTENRAAFLMEGHWHTQMVCAGNVSGVDIRPRTQLDFTGRTGTIQFEVDDPPVMTSHGKWWSVHVTQNEPSLPSSFGDSTGDQFPNSVEFGVYENADRPNYTPGFNLPFIAVNVNGSIQRFVASEGVLSPSNVRLPVVLKISRTTAEMWINGVRVVQASGFTLPFEKGWVILGQKNYGAGKVDYERQPSMILQLNHWETLQFDGPEGTYSPLMKTFIQPGCDGSADDGHNVIVGCSAFVDDHRTSNSFTFALGSEAASARSVRLLVNGKDPSSFTAILNGHSQQVSITNYEGGDFEQINAWSLNPTWLVNGTNTLTINAPGASYGLAQVELEVVFNQPHVLTEPTQFVPHPLMALTNGNFRVEHVPGDPIVHTLTTYVYSQGIVGTIPFSATVVSGGEWLSITPGFGLLQSPAEGGGLQALTMSVNFSGIDDNAEGIIRIDGAEMPAYIGVYAVREDSRTQFTQIDPSYYITNFNKNAIPDYHGAGGGGTPTPTSPVPPTATSHVPATPTHPMPPTSTATGVAPSPTPTSTAPAQPTFGAHPTNTPWPSLCSESFIDVPRDHWAWNYVTYMACHDIVNGYPDGTFHPNHNVSRGQVAKIVSNSAGFDDDPGGQIYQDVPANSPFFVWINRLSRRGIVGGYDCGGSPDEPCLSSNMPYFRPGAPTSRAQVAKIVSNASGFNDSPNNQLFADVPPGSTFYIWVQRLANRDIMSGYDCGADLPCTTPDNLPYFMPGNNATRAQVAKIVGNALILPSP